MILSHHRKMNKIEADMLYVKQKKTTNKQINVKLVYNRYDIKTNFHDKLLKNNKV